MAAPLVLPRTAITVLPLRITIPGAIVPWQRGQRHQLDNGAVVTFTARKVENYHAVVHMAAARVMDGHPPLDCALELAMMAVFPVPASWSGVRRGRALAGDLKKTSRHDIENSVKGVLDALQGVVYRDDSQVVHLIARKCYGDRPRLEIMIVGA